MFAKKQGNKSTAHPDNDSFDQVAKDIGARIYSAGLRASADRDNVLLLFHAIGEVLVQAGEIEELSDAALSKLSSRLGQCYPFLARSLTAAGLKGMWQLAYDLQVIDQPDSSSLAFDRLSKGNDFQSQQLN